MWRAVFLLTALMIVMALTLPWNNFQGHSHWAQVEWIPFSGDVSWFDVAANVLLFVPLGFSCRKAFPGLGAGRIAGFSALLSIFGELLQSFSHSRVSSITDVLMNILGAGVGALLASFDKR